MNNIISAIINLVKSPQLHLNQYAKSHNRVNNVGEALEEYVKDLFADSLGMIDGAERNEKLNKTFSYIGNQNNPPDIMIRGGDAIEVKKIESKGSALALNSSYPKAKLFADSTMLTKACKECEEWTQKDMIYTVGVVKNDNLLALAMVYGDEYCANSDVYERIKTTIKDGVTTIPSVEFSETKELGHVNRVDPLGITYLRIRGMWGIANPFVAFKYVYQQNKDAKFSFFAIISNSRFASLDNTESLIKLSKENSDLQIADVKVKDPNNPAKLIESKLIKFTII